MTSNRTRHLRRGLTLVELMVVILIIGIIAGGAMFAFAGAPDEARSSRAGSEISSMTQAITTFRMKKSAYPSDLQELTSSGILEAVPEEDPWGRPYIYESQGSGGFKLYSKGVKEEDDSDDIYYDFEKKKVVIPEPKKEQGS